MMFRILGLLACWLVAWNCADKALGTAPQVMIAPNYLWFWWIVAAGWIINGVCVVAFGGGE